MSNITPVKVEGEYCLRHNGDEKELHAALLEASDYCPVNITYKDKRYTVINDMAWGKSPDLIEAIRLFLGAHEGSWEDFPEFAGQREEPVSQLWRGKMNLDGLVIETVEAGSFIKTRSTLHNHLADHLKMVRTLETDSFVEYVIQNPDGIRVGTAVVEEVKA